MRRTDRLESTLANSFRTYASPFCSVCFFWVGYNIMVSLQVSSSLDLLEALFFLILFCISDCFNARICSNLQSKGVSTLFCFI